MKIRVREDWKYFNVDVRNSDCPKYYCFWIEKKFSKYLCGRRERQGCPDDLNLLSERCKWHYDRGVWKEIK